MMFSQYRQPRVGDMGQRYMVVGVGWPKNGPSGIAYTDNLPRAKDIAASAMRAPVCVTTLVIDRTLTMTVYALGKPFDNISEIEGVAIAIAPEGKPV